MTVNTATDFPVEIAADYGIPQSFLSYSATEPCCIFMLSCHSRGKYYEMGSSPKAVVGYSAAQFQKGGMPFWFSLIHPEDLPLVTGKIIEAHAHPHLTRPRQDSQEGPAPFPLLLIYRIHHPDGKYIHVRDTRYLLSGNQENTVDNIICRVEAIRDADSGRTANNERPPLERPCTKMLEAAILHQAARQKTTLTTTLTTSPATTLATAPSHPKQNAPMHAPALAMTAPALTKTTPRLTAREKEILQMIADGLSSKMIADRCRISKNTVETHRRHLLEKLGVKNSMELIKEASKVFVL